MDYLVSVKLGEKGGRKNGKCIDGSRPQKQIIQARLRTTTGWHPPTYGLRSASPHPRPRPPLSTLGRGFHAPGPRNSSSKDVRGVGLGGGGQSALGLRRGERNVRVWGNKRIGGGEDGPVNVVVPRLAGESRSSVDTRRLSNRPHHSDVAQ